MDFYSNEGSRSDEDLESTAVLVGITTAILVLLLALCLFRFYCVVRRLRRLKSEEIKRLEGLFIDLNMVVPNSTRDCAGAGA